MSLCLGRWATAAETPPEAWVANPLRWTIEGRSLHTSGRGAGFALLETVPVCSRVSVAADVSIARPASDSWKVAGVAIHCDGGNYWHLALVMPPDGQPGSPMVELAEMRNGVWLSQGDLRRVVDESRPGAWKLGQAYRLSIVLDPQGIEGTVTDGQGTQVRRLRFAFSAPAVTSGRPALRSEGFAAAFSNVEVSHSEPVPLTAAAPVQPYATESFVREIRGKATGYFHVEFSGDTWWVIDPAGRGFVPLGVDHANYRGHGCEKLGYAPYGRNNERKFGRVEPWAEETVARLRTWGFNLLGAGCSKELNHRGLAHTLFSNFGRSMSAAGDAYDILPDRFIPCSGFPNVFHPDFERHCRFQARQLCAESASDPWLFGYFLDNELDWWAGGDPDSGLFDAVLKKSPTHTAKRALRDFFAGRYADVARFNAVWGTRFASLDELLSCDRLPGPKSDGARADQKDFIGLIADRYFGTVCRAIRAVDPNHMVLGCRFAGGHASESVWRAAGRHCDLLTFNYYGNVDLDRGIARDHYHARRGKPLADDFQKFYDWGARPMMVTEWSFPALDAGLPSRHGAGQRFRTQAQRAKATEIFARTMLAIPYLVGYDYFMWVDEPALGISARFPEDSNYGLVNEDGVPYSLLTAALTRVHQQSGRVRRAGLAGLPAATTPAPGLSPLVRVLDCAAAAEKAGKPANESLRFTRQGDGYLASNGLLEIRGTLGSGGLTDEVRHRGLVLGRYNALVQQWTGQNQWIDAERLVDVRGSVHGDVMTVDLVGRYDAPAGQARRSFEVTHRLILLPQRDWFVAQWLGCRNVDHEPLDLRAAFFRLNSAIGGSADDDLATDEGGAPRVWGDVVGDAWLDAKAGAFWGVAAGDEDPLKIQFWRDQYGQHPDARYELHARIAPGETYRPNVPVAVLVIAGRGDREAWSLQARKLLESLP